MSFIFHRLRKRAIAGAGRLARSATFVSVVLISGLGSSCYMVDAGTGLTTATVGPWVTWTAASRADADPYTRAHYARLGALPLSSEVAQLYIAKTDSDGRRLHSSCEYEIEGRNISTHWWSITVYDDDGNLIPNAAERYSFTSDTIAVHPDSRYVVTLARDARHDNWLPTGGAGRLSVAFHALDLGIRAVARDEDIVQKLLPTIKRTACR
jgi:hypothetical protein